MTPVTLRRVQARFQQAIDAEIDRLLLTRSRVRPFYTMMRYQLGYADRNGHPYTGAAGKRFRPGLCLLACEAVSGAWAPALSAAAGIELIHNFSLIHDDIEDRDPIRHHRETVWKVWGEPHAINAGDGMLALATAAFLQSAHDPLLTLEVTRAAQLMTLDLTEGQYLDMSFEHRESVTPAEYMEMISLKTGAIIAFSMWCGARLGGADERRSDAMARFGLDMGRAFQIRDDIAGIWAEREHTGKAEARDLINRKKTLPVLLAREAADAAARTELDRFYARTTGDVDMVRDVLERTDAQRRARQAAEEHLEAASRAIVDADIPEQYRDELEGLARELAGQ